MMKRGSRPCKNCGKLGHYEKTCKTGKRCAYDRKTECPGNGKDRCVAYCPPEGDQKPYCGRGKFFLGNTKQIPIEINVQPRRALIERYDRL